MSPIGISVSPPRPLPQVPGPKLAPFTPTAHADIEFIEELGNPEEDLDAHVWKVSINGATPYYALKMFRFRSPEYLRSTMGRHLMRPLSSPLSYIDYLDPFNSECRAYGRLREEDRQDLAVRAHGYLLLTPQQEAEVTERARGMHYPPAGPATPLNGANSWGRWEVHRGVSVRAIVKELVTEHEPPFTSTQLGDLWRDLEDLHKLGILVRDIGPGNYMGGKLIDFSQSWTMPNPCLEYILPDALCEQRESDPLNLEACIVDWGIANRWDWDEVEFPAELRDCASGTGPNEGYGTDPRLYDWRKWEGDLDAVDAFLEHELYIELKAEQEEGDEEEGVRNEGGEEGGGTGK